MNIKFVEIMSRNVSDAKDKDNDYLENTIKERPQRHLIRVMRRHDQVMSSSNMRTASAAQWEFPMDLC